MALRIDFRGGAFRFLDSDIPDNLAASWLVVTQYGRKPPLASEIASAASGNDPAPTDALALHVHELKAELRDLRADNLRLREALRLTASRRDVFNAGLSIILVFLVLGFGIIFKMDAIKADSAWHYVHAAVTSSDNAARILPASTAP